MTTLIDTTGVRDAARAAARTLAAGTEVPWTAVLMFEGVETGDHRIFEDVTWRELPLPLMAQTMTADGHNGAAIAGRIETIEKDGERIVGTGVFDSGEFGQEIARLVEARTLRGVSVDLGDLESKVVGDRLDENGMPTLLRFPGIAILGATVLPHPAFAGAEIAVGTGVSSPEQDDDSESELEDVAAGARIASGGVPAPPLTAFDNPFLPCRSGIEIDDDGRIYGHIYGWGECHIGSENVCLTAPPSVTDYAYFTTGKIPTAEGVRVPTGPLVIDADHALVERGVTWMAARDHYSHTGLAVADVAIGDDDHGIWIAGVLRPTATPEQIYILQASALSGDWRRIDGHLELVAILAVNTPGYPAPRALVAAGEVQALVAAVGTLSPTEGDDCGCGSAAIEARMARLERIVAPLYPAAIEALAATLDPPTS